MKEKKSVDQRVSTYVIIGILIFAMLAIFTFWPIYAETIRCKWLHITIICAIAIRFVFKLIEIAKYETAKKN